MSSDAEQFKEQLKVDVASLYREETFTDMKAATFKIMTPVDAAGNEDTSREKFISAHTTVMSPMGAIPLQSKLEATDLAAAAEEFPEAIKKAMDKLLDEAREMQRQEASKIVVPDAVQASKIQLA